MLKGIGGRGILEEITVCIASEQLKSNEELCCEEEQVREKINLVNKETKDITRKKKFCKVRSCENKKKVK